LIFGQKTGVGRAKNGHLGFKRANLGDLGKREIGPRFEDSEKLARRDLRSLRDKFASSLIGFVFPEPEGVVYVHNPLLKQSLRSFEHPANWVCFGFVFS